jgi:hypothetical protein
MGLPLHDTKPTPIPPPEDQAEADITFPGIHLVELHIQRMVAGERVAHRSDYGVRIYWGILPTGGASATAATSEKRELMAPPKNGQDLPHSIFTRRQKHLFDFLEEDRGKRVYFCLRYENSKGEGGPWGKIMDVVIP